MAIAQRDQPPHSSKTERKNRLVHRRERIVKRSTPPWTSRHPLSETRSGQLVQVVPVLDLEAARTAFGELGGAPNPPTRCPEPPAEALAVVLLAEGFSSKCKKNPQMCLPMSSLMDSIVSTKQGVVPVGSTNL